MYRQGDLERRLGMSVTPACDRHGLTRVGLQRGFVAFIGPLYRGIAALLPQLAPLVARLECTRRSWDEEPLDSDEWARGEVPDPSPDDSDVDWQVQVSLPPAGRTRSRARGP
jgi:hypothetical protein